MKTLPSCRIKTLSLLLAVSWASLATAQPVDLADAPLATENKVQPTVMFTVDDSTSMTWPYSPQTLSSAYPDHMKFMAQVTDSYPGAGDTESIRKQFYYENADGTPSDALMDSSINRLAYDPLVDYVPPLDGEGNPLPEMNAANTANYTNVGWQTAWEGRPLPVNLSEYSADSRGVYFFLKGTRHPLNFHEPASNPASFSWNYTDAWGEQQTKTRPAQDQGVQRGELTNYANWAAYYRNRVAASKSAASLAFNAIVCDPVKNPKTCDLSKLPYIGFTTITQDGYSAATKGPGSSVLNLAQARLAPGAFQDEAFRKKFFDSLLAFPTWGGTPLREALHQVGLLFQDPSSGYIRQSCQRNYNVLFTDGLWNSGFSGGFGNQDSTLTAPLPETASFGRDITVYGMKLKQGDAWPKPIQNGPAQSPSLVTLADVALHYWMTDLRPDMTNNVVTTASDPATWQHLNFIGMGFGVHAQLPDDMDTAIREIVSGKTNWPNVDEYSNSGDDDPNKVDDLMHASVNGFGRYVSSNSPNEFKVQLLSILNEIIQLGGSRTQVSLTNLNLSINDEEYIYNPLFTSGWGGDIIKRKINQKAEISDIIDATSKTIVATAAEQLEKKLAAPDAWKNSRSVFTSIGGTKVDFSYAALKANLSSAKMAEAFGDNAKMQEHVIDYLRGDRRGEGYGSGMFRKRAKGPLGDIVNAQLIVVGAPACFTNPKTKRLACNYDENKNPGYQKFYEDNKNRALTIYAAANDGMLHAFDKDLNELWAYVPSNLIRSREKGGLINLTVQESDPEQPFSHHYFVDATPRQFDVQFEDGSWHTVLVGGLGKGGNAYYALDITKPASPEVLWEFTDDDMGYTFGRATLTKTQADWGPDTWVAVLPSGYNNGSGDNMAQGNGDGQGHVFFIDIESGKKLAAVSTTEGGTANQPLNLAYISTFTESSRNQVATAVYGADERGTLWRFNIADSDSSKWEATKLGELKDPAGKAQYVTTEPFLVVSRGQRYVLIGTGGFRNSVDLVSTDRTNTVYAFRDGGRTDAGSHTNVTRSQMAELAYNVAEPTLSAAASNARANYGWYMDMPVNYHVNVPIKGVGDHVAYAANHYNAEGPGYAAGVDPCKTAVFESYNFARNARTGKSVLMENGKTQVANIKNDLGTAGIEVVQAADGTLYLLFSMFDGSGTQQPVHTIEEPDLNDGIPNRSMLRYVTDR